MEDAGLANELARLVGEEVALSGDHRGRHRALIAADDGEDTLRQRIAGAVDRRGRREPGPTDVGGGEFSMRPSTDPTPPILAK